MREGAHTHTHARTTRTRTHTRNPLPRAQSSLLSTFSPLFSPSPLAPSHRCPSPHAHAPAVSSRLASRLHAAAAISHTPAVNYESRNDLINVNEGECAYACCILAMWVQEGECTRYDGRTGCENFWRSVCVGVRGWVAHQHSLPHTLSHLTSSFLTSSPLSLSRRSMQDTRPLLSRSCRYFIYLCKYVCVCVCVCVCV